MNRYDYYTRCTNFDEQEWMTEEIYYPDGDDCNCCSDYADDYDLEYEDDATMFDCEEEDWEEAAEDYEEATKDWIET